jgi:Tfp pilus assembly protein PilZ
VLIRDAHIEFADPTAFLEEYERSLSSGWTFIASEADFELGEVLEVTLDLSFCSRSVRVLGVVTSRVIPALARMLERPAGVVVEFADGIGALDEMIRDTIASLESSPWTRSDSSRSPRRHARFPVSIKGSVESAHSRVPAQTLNVSMSGALLELPALDFDVGEHLELQLTHPRTGETVALSARVVRQDPRPDRTTGVAVEFDAPDMDGRKARFLDQVRAVTHGRQVGGVSGNLSGLSLPSLLQSIATSSERGTMDIIGEREEAHLLFEGNRLRYAAIGKIEGVKALARLMEWPEGEFSFQPSIESGEPERVPVPIEQAVMEAVHQAEELRRLDSVKLPDTVVLERMALPLSPAPSQVESDVLELLARPACPSALLDALPHSDVEIWRAILDLVERSAVRVRA